MSSISNFHNQLNQSDGSGGADSIQVPQRFRDFIDTLSDQFDELASRGGERTHQINKAVESWNKFRAELEELRNWVWSQEAELEDLRVIERFAREFSSHTTRLEVGNSQ